MAQINKVEVIQTKNKTVTSVFLDNKEVHRYFRSYKKLPPDYVIRYIKTHNHILKVIDDLLIFIFE